MNSKRTTPVIDCAYYEGHWVYVPLFYVPENAIDDDGLLYRFRVTPVDGQELSDPPLRRSCEDFNNYINSTVMETILPDRLSEKNLKKLCFRNGIPIEWVSNKFKKELRSRDIKRAPRKASQRKSPPMNAKEYKSFVRELDNINKTAKVIAEILWFINKSLDGNDYITLEEVIRLEVINIDVDDRISKCISLFRSSPKGSHMVTHFLPDRIWNALNRQMRKGSLFAFSNKNRAPFFPGDIDRFFKKAGKNTGIKEPVSSLSLRPISVLHVNEKPFEEISQKEWGELCFREPRLIEKKGRPSMHDPRVLMNAIFYHLRTKIPIRELPSWRAVHSQYRRWKKSGVFDAVIIARQREF